jgi:hypothetical protein
MALALPVLGALGGIGAASALGYTSLTALTIGANVGWLVGSWAMMATMDTKNDPIDSGAHEAPRFNTAVRGATVPVLFGTNRVPGQIPWQANFEAIRKENASGGGGGKFGGSGGGKAPKTSGSDSYEYKIDAIYHLGMSSVPLQIIGGWLAGERINDASLNGLASTGLLGYSAGIPDADRVGISYDEAVYFPGNVDEEDTWAYFTGQVGAPIVWPGTAWVGFRGLDMGQIASMPQLSFEVGPVGGNVEYNSEVLWGGGNWHFSGGLDNNLNLHVYNSTTNIFQGKDADGNILYTLDEDNDDIEALFNAVGPDIDPSWNRVGGDFIYVSPCGNYLVVLLQRYDGGRYNTWVGICDIPERGVVAQPTIINYVKFFSQIKISWGENQQILDYLYDLNNEPTAMIMLADDWHLATLNIIYLPTPADIIAGTYKGSHPLGPSLILAGDECPVYMYQIENGEGYNWLFTNLNNMGDSSHIFTGHVTSTVNVGGLAPTIECRFWGYMAATLIDYADTVSSLPNELADSIRATYPYGSMWYIDLPHTSYAGISWSGTNPRQVVNHTDNFVFGSDLFVDESGLPAVPFGDDGQGGRWWDGVESGNKPYYNARPVVSQYSAGVPLLLFFGMSTDNTYDDVFGEICIVAKIRAFYWDAAQSKFVLLGTDKGYLVRESDTGIVFGTTASVDMVHPRYYDGDLYFGGVGSVGGDTSWLAKFGSIEVAATDVTPPYIIKQILINEVFGLQPGDDDIIDSDSYTTAHQYCLDNGYVISTQYRRTGPALTSIELLMAIYGGYIVCDVSAGKVKFGVMDLQNLPVRTIDNNHLLIMNEGEPPVNIKQGAPQDTYNLIRVNFINRDHDYQNDQREARDEVDEDLTGTRLREFPPEFVMEPELAEKIADRALWSNLYNRDGYQFHLGWKDSDLEPGDVITLVDSFSALNQVAMITRWREVERGTYEVHASQQVPYIPSILPSAITSATLGMLNNPTISSSVGYLTSSGTVVYSGIVTDPSCRYTHTINGAVPAPAYFQAYELPAEFGSQGVYVGWRAEAFAKGANLYVSPDGITYASMQNVEPYLVAGTLISELPGNPEQAFAEGVEFLLHPTANWSVDTPTYTHNTTINDISASAVHAGAGLVYIGSEMTAFEGLTLVDQNRYRARRVYRGWGGTKVGAHSSGDTWHRHNTGLFFQDYSDDQIGTTFWYKVAPYNMSGYEYNVASINAKSYTIKGSLLRPQVAPALNVFGARRSRRLYVGSEVDIPFDWQDSARQSGYGAGGYGTAPGNYGGFTTDTLSHNWRVTITGSGGTVVRSTVVTTPNFTYTNSMNFADNGAWRGNVALEVMPFSPYGDAPHSAVASLELYF